jgi:hypothetical protein
LTIIAFDGTTLVADGRCTRIDGSLVSDSHRKLHKVKIKQFGGDCIVGLCGGMDAVGPFLNHLEDKGLVPMEHFNFNNAEEELAYHIRGIAVNRKGQCFEFTSDGGWVEVNGPTTVGCGEKVAQHYLYKGSSALEAVVETCKTELACGGTLLAYDWKSNTLTELVPQRPVEAPYSVSKAS